MAIEFRCPSCSKLLRVADAAAGKQAKCPSCSHQMLIPAMAVPPITPQQAGPQFPGPASPPRQTQQPQGQASSPFDLFGHAASGDRRGPYAENPYQSPQSGTYAPPLPSVASRGRALDVGDVFNQTWSIFQQQMLMCIAGPLVAGLAGSIAFVAIDAALIVIAKIARSPELFILCQMMLVVLAVAILIFIQIGLAIYFLRIARGQAADLADLFRAGPFLVHGVGSHFVEAFAVAIGNMFCFVPGVILSLMFSQHKYLIVDRNQRVIDSLTQSHNLTNGNKLNLFVLWIVAALVYLAGGLACFVGLFAAIPFVQLMNAVIYLTLCGQTAGEQPGRVQNPLLTPLR